MLIGADIEFFIKDKKTGKIIPSCGLIGGEKNNPKVLDGRYSILEDGAAVELNYAPTASYSSAGALLAGSAQAISAYTGYSVYTRPEARIAGLSKFPQANTIGCAEDYWAYAENPMVPRPTPNIESFGNYRFAGGHLHLGYNTVEDVPPFVAARFIDAWLTLPLIVHVAKNFPDKYSHIFGTRRKQHYGLPGLYRPKAYGVEYRTLSNFFAFDIDLSLFVTRKLYEVGMALENRVAALNTAYLRINWQQVQEALTSSSMTKQDAVNTHTTMVYMDTM